MIHYLQCSNKEALSLYDLGHGTLNVGVDWSDASHLSLKYLRYFCKLKSDPLLASISSPVKMFL